MDRLGQWIVHRTAVIGLSWPEGLADASGMAADALASIAARGRLHGMGRSAQGYLAGALKVSVRELETLAAGKIAWIDDAHMVDLDRLSPYASALNQPIATPIPCRQGRGVPILGRVLADGVVESFESWTPEEGPRLPIRYRGVADAFALELTIAIAPYSAGVRLAFRIIAPGELAENELALLTYSHRESQTCLHRARWLSSQSLQLAPNETSGIGGAIVPLSDVLRAARVIDACEMSR